MAETGLLLKQSPAETLQLTSLLKEIIIDSDQDVIVNMEVKDQQSVSAVIRLRAAASLNVTVKVEEGSNATLLYWNETDAPVVVEEHNDVYRDASLKTAYIQLNKGTVQHKGVTLLKEEGAQAQLHAAVIAQTNKNFMIDCVHEAGHTTGIIESYCIVLEGGRYRMEATGKINKGARGAKSHQTSRALTFDAKQTATILPKLLIDENDVEASHAMTIGQMDENQMYYLQSRGLTEEEAIGLVTLGYLLPIVRISDDPELKKALQQEIEMKVKEVCLTSSK